MKFNARFLPMMPKPGTRIPSCPKCFMEVTMMYIVVPTLRSRMKSFWFLGVKLPKVFLRLRPCDHELYGNDIGTFSIKVMGLNSQQAVDTVDTDMTAPKPMFKEGS